MTKIELIGLVDRIGLCVGAKRVTLPREDAALRAVVGALPEDYESAAPRWTFLYQAAGDIWAVSTRRFPTLEEALDYAENNVSGSCVAVELPE